MVKPLGLRDLLTAAVECAGVLGAVALVGCGGEGAGSPSVGSLADDLTNTRFPNYPSGQCLTTVQKWYGTQDYRKASGFDPVCIFSAMAANPADLSGDDQVCRAGSACRLWLDPLYPFTADWNSYAWNAGLPAIAPRRYDLLIFPASYSSSLYSTPLTHGRTGHIAILDEVTAWQGDRIVKIRVQDSNYWGDEKVHNHEIDTTKDPPLGFFQRVSDASTAGPWEARSERGGAVTVSAANNCRRVE